MLEDKCNQDIIPYQDYGTYRGGKISTLLGETLYFRFYLEIGKQSILQSILFRKDLFELYNMAERKRKNSKIYSRQFQFELFFSNGNCLL